MNIESGRRDQDGRRRRHVTVDEWLALAHAFDVEPIVLLLPEEADAEYKVTPDTVASAVKVMHWLVGQHPLRFGDSESPFGPKPEMTYLNERPPYMWPGADAVESDRLAQIEALLKNLLKNVEAEVGLTDEENPKGGKGIGQD
jgi:hypothetical protein